MVRSTFLFLPLYAVHVEPLESCINLLAFCFLGWSENAFFCWRARSEALSWARWCRCNNLLHSHQWISHLWNRGESIVPQHFFAWRTAEPRSNMLWAVTNFPHTCKWSVYLKKTANIITVCQRYFGNKAEEIRQFYILLMQALTA